MFASTMRGTKISLGKTADVVFLYLIGGDGKSQKEEKQLMNLV